MQHHSVSPSEVLDTLTQQRHEDEGSRAVTAERNTSSQGAVFVKVELRDY